jgi:hypothetical protein
VNYHRNADAFLTLETGGKAKSARKQIYHFSATANEITNHYAGDPDWEYYHERTRALAAMNITIGTLPPGSDGTVWQAIEDGRILDVTPRVKNVDYYIFNLYPSKVQTKADWQQVVQSEIDNDSGVTIRDYRVGNDFSNTPSASARGAGCGCSSKLFRCRWR